VSTDPLVTPADDLTPRERKALKRLESLVEYAHRKYAGDFDGIAIFVPIRRSPEHVALFCTASGDIAPGDIAGYVSQLQPGEWEAKKP
jgi:hypothetical protein